MKLGWRSGYQRRGFVTFKTDRSFFAGDLDATPACARRLCLSLGKTNNHASALDLLGEVVKVHECQYFERRMQGIRPDLPADDPKVGDWVGTVVKLSDEEFWAGIHCHTRLTSPDPAGDSGIQMPVDSPSRAWLKLEEAARFFDLRFTSTDLVAEVGCAPGGVVLALLSRGVRVVGIDPAKMAPVILKSEIQAREHAAAKEGPWFLHCRKPAALTAKRDIQGATWFMSDMNQSPEVVLTECARFCRMAPSIRGALITLKLTDPTQVVEKERWFSAVREMGFRTIRLQQLAVHHKELALLAMR